MSKPGKLPPIVSVLTGCLRKAKGKNVKESFADYLMGKYR
jgi:hypothetical protein